MKKNKSNQIATIAIFIAVMIVINILSSIIFNILPVPIKPTIVHIPVIIASIIYGPRVGACLGALMGLMSMTHNTINLLPPAIFSRHLLRMVMFIQSSLQLSLVY